LRLLVDQNLPYRICEPLAAAGHDVVHVQSVSLDRAEDVEILAHAAREGRIVISSDTDFGALLAASRSRGPSVVLTREVSTLPLADLASLLVANLPAVADALEAGAIVALTRSAIRVRKLPLP
jgi:predicted nuclease of predicted toxin-antitoxin system